MMSVGVAVLIPLGAGSDRWRLGASCASTALLAGWALAIAWMLGPRRSKYGVEGMPAAIPGQNVVLVMFACVLALLGWFGLNGWRHSLCRR